MPTDFGTLVVIVVVVILLLKFLKASVKLIVTAAIIAAVVWAIMTYGPELMASIPTGGVQTWNVL